MRCSSKHMKAKYWCRHELIIAIFILTLLSFIVTKLPACYDEDIRARRVSRLNTIQVNEDEKDEHSGMKYDHLGAAGENVKLPEDNKLIQRTYKKPNAPYEEIDCLINDDYSIKGRREGNETFLPFSFLEKYFEIDGRISRQPDERHQDRFDWAHSTARVYNQRPYQSNGTFMTFDHYHVEQRASVKYISGVEGKKKGFINVT